MFCPPPWKLTPTDPYPAVVSMKLIPHSADASALLIPFSPWLEYEFISPHRKPPGIFLVCTAVASDCDWLVTAGSRFIRLARVAVDVPAVPPVRHGKRFVVGDETADGDATIGMVGTNGVSPTVPTAGDTVIVGTAAAELTPRLPISVDPNGIPVRGAPPGVVGDVGVDDEAMLLEPEPHIPDMPEVSGIPDVVEIPDVADIPDDVDIPDDADSPDVAVPIAIPPPS